MKPLILSLCLLASLALPAVHAQNQALWTNPLVEQRADPFVYHHTDGYYYMTATVPTWDYLELRRATTIDGLRTAQPQVIWRKHSSGPMGGFIWAPELHYMAGRWYLFFGAGSSSNNWAVRLYVLENDSANPMEGAWTEKGRIDTGFDTFALDPTVFQNKGTWYLVWAQANPKIKVNSCIYIAAMDSPWSIVKPAVMLSKPEFPWECVRYKVNEGPEILQHGNRIFLTYSASGIGSEYCMGMLSTTADSDLLDPQSWTKSPTPVFKTSVENSQYGPGHNGFTKLPDGTDVNVYHDRNYDVKGDPLKDQNRHVRAQIVTWNADGTPDLGTPVPDGPYSPGNPLH